MDHDLNRIQSHTHATLVSTHAALESASLRLNHMRPNVVVLEASSAEVGDGNSKFLSLLPKSYVVQEFKDLKISHVPS